MKQNSGLGLIGAVILVVLVVLLLGRAGDSSTEPPQEPTPTPDVEQSPKDFLDKESFSGYCNFVRQKFIYAARQLPEDVTVEQARASEVAVAKSYASSRGVSLEQADKELGQCRIYVVEWTLNGIK